MKLLSPLDEKIVLVGMSCSGKTTFASMLEDHEYYCFDSLFHWHLVETLGLSISENLKHVSNVCAAESYVLDGWHLTNRDLIPRDASVYVIYANYQNIIDQYRVPIRETNEHLHMYHKWYGSSYPDRSVRYFKNDGVFVETTSLECSPEIEETFESQEKN